MQSPAPNGRVILFSDAQELQFGAVSAKHRIPERYRRFRIREALALSARITMVAGGSVGKRISTAGVAQALMFLNQRQTSVAKLRHENRS